MVVEYLDAVLASRTVTSFSWSDYVAALTNTGLNSFRRNKETFKLVRRTFEERFFRDDAWICAGSQVEKEEHGYDRDEEDDG